MLFVRVVTIGDTAEWSGIPHRNRVALFYSCRRFRRKGRMPITMLNAVGGEVDRIVGWKRALTTTCRSGASPLECAR
jgi:hypothetical protein